MGVSEYGSYELFVECCYVFLGVTVSCVSKGAHDVQSSFCSIVNVSDVVFERHAAVICYSKDFRGVVYGKGSVVECYVWMGSVFKSVRCN